VREATRSLRSAGCPCAPPPPVPEGPVISRTNGTPGPEV
jgi:hypothetical protein